MTSRRKKYAAAVAAVLVILVAGSAITVTAPWADDSCRLEFEHVGSSLAEVSELAKKTIETVGYPPCTVEFKAYDGRSWFTWGVKLTFHAPTPDPTAVATLKFGLGSLD